MQGDERDQRQRGPRDPEEGAGGEHHVQARDRHDVIDAGGPERVVGVLVDQASLAGDQRRRNRTRRTANGVRDPSRERVPGGIDRCGGSKREGRRLRRRGLLDLARDDPTAPMPRKYASRAKS
jgi:hypothetical protein